jgi:hypothetical protein
MVTFDHQLPTSMIVDVFSRCDSFIMVGSNWLVGRRQPGDKKGTEKYLLQH